MRADWMFAFTVMLKVCVLCQLRAGKLLACFFNLYNVDFVVFNLK